LNPNKAEITGSISDPMDCQNKLGKRIQSVTIPATIQDIIMAGIDFLTEGSKEIIKLVQSFFTGEFYFTMNIDETDSNNSH
jgi:hypothetical protein